MPVPTDVVEQRGRLITSGRVQLKTEARELFERRLIRVGGFADYFHSVGVIQSFLERPEREQVFPI